MESGDFDSVGEVFVAFAKAMATAQTLELDLLSLSLLVRAHEKGGVTPSELEYIDAQLSKKTLGAMLRALEQGGYIERSLHRDWFRALETRNRLAHRFFIDNLERLLTSASQLVVAEELRQDDDLLFRVREEVCAVTRQVVQAFGIDEEEFLRAVAEEQRKIFEES